MEELAAMKAMNAQLMSENAQLMSENAQLMSVIADLNTTLKVERNVERQTITFWEAKYNNLRHFALFMETTFGNKITTLEARIARLEA